MNGVIRHSRLIPGIDYCEVAFGSGPGLVAYSSLAVRSVDGIEDPGSGLRRVDIHPLVVEHVPDCSLQIDSGNDLCGRCPFPSVFGRKVRREQIESEGYRYSSEVDEEGCKLPLLMLLCHPECTSTCDGSGLRDPVVAVQ